MPWTPNGGKIMPTIRLTLVLVLIAAAPSTGFSQLLPRRRVAHAVDAVARPEIERSAPWIAQVLADAVKDALKDFGLSLEVSFSVQLFGELQMDPQLKKRIASNTDPDSPAAWAMELMNNGGTHVFLAETAKLADKLKREGYSPPVLEKMYLEYEYAGRKPFKDDIGMPGHLSSEPMTQSGWFESQDAAKPPAIKRTVMLHEGNRPHHPKNPNPLTIHCALVFATKRDGKDATKTLWFDMYRDDLKIDPAARVMPWKVKNVQDN